MSRGKAQGVDPNPKGFADRLRFLMEGEGLALRALADRAGVSHGTIGNWLAGSSRAGPAEVESVARVFGWTAAELYHGEPRIGVMTTLAKLEGFRARVRRMATELADAADSARFASEAEIPVAPAAEMEDEATNGRRASR